MTPDSNTNQEVFIEVGDGHQLYAQDWGFKDAKTPIINFHGGPGGGTNNGHKVIFDPSKHRVIFFDQRGSGRSLPYGSLQNNTTDDLVEDINKIADHFKLDKFVLCGGSWGSALPLVYAIKHPKRVHSMVLRSIFTGSKFETEWFEQGIFSSHYPEVWERLLERTPKAHHANPAAYHYDKIKNGSAVEMLESALAVEETEGRLIRIDDRFKPLDPANFDPNAVTIFVHYASNNWFMPEDFILNNAHKLTMPIQMVHGRYDMDCPPITAYKLDQKMPNSQLTWVISGHRAEHEMETAMRLILQNIS
ncbi:MAG TPA: alpha/beta fold hydrolase [Patescibacteria group bacterium]|nr:alpha/beta fold hydrolase [Patescibacteria group bacterium]